MNPLAPSLTRPLSLSRPLALALSLSLLAFACAAPAIPGGTDDGTGTDGTDPNASKKPATTAPEGTDPSTPTPAPTTPSPAPTTPAPAPTTPTPAPSADCSGQTTADACFDCCNAPTSGALAAADDVFGQCACGASGACGGACGDTLCNGGPPSTSCAQCLAATCEPAENAACTSAACQGGLACLQASGCDAKP